MSQPEIFKPGRHRLAAVVLNRYNYSEADYIVTFLTRELGLLNALARYGRRSIRRFGGGILSAGTAAWYNFTLKPNTDLAFVEDGEENPKAARLPADPLIQALAAYALEMVRGFEAYRNPAEESFNLLVRHLSRLSRCGDALSARRLSLDFALSYMELAGFGPRLDACIVCEEPVEDGRGWRWDPFAGGIFCPHCPDAGARRVRALSAGLLRRLCLGTAEADELKKDDLAEAELFFQHLAEHHMGRRLKSLISLKQLLRD